jgi:hypothetical protein
MATNTSPNMNLAVPVVSVELGPAWAVDLYNALYTGIDQHDHSSGKGVQVTPAGLNINADLSFTSLAVAYNAKDLRSSRYASQSAALALGTDVGCLYNVLGDAYWNNGAGTAIQLTKSGALNVTIQSFPLRSVSGTVTILATDPYTLYYVDVSAGAATLNLPASSALMPGRALLVVDIKKNSETNAISLVPNGTDKINGVNATFTIQFNGTTSVLTTDGAGNWYAQDEGASYLRAAGIKFSGTFTLDATTSAGVLALQANDTTYAFVSANASGPGLGIGTTPGTDPTITRGTGVPATTQPNGSLFLRTDGSGTTALYSRQGGGWNVIAGFAAPVTGTARTEATTYTIDSAGSDWIILADTSGAAWTLTLPTPTLGRQLFVIDKAGTFGTNNLTLARHAAEQINGVAASKVLSAPGGIYVIFSADGTNWSVAGM